MWSAINKAEDYVPSTSSDPSKWPDYLPDGGQIVGVELDEVVIREMMIRRLDYVTPPKIIRWGDL